MLLDYLKIKGAFLFHLALRANFSCTKMSTYCPRSGILLIKAQKGLQLAMCVCRDTLSCTSRPSLQCGNSCRMKWTFELNQHISVEDAVVPKPFAE